MPPIQRRGMFTAPASLPDDPATLKAVLSAALAEIARLHQLIAGLQRLYCGTDVRHPTALIQAGEGKSSAWH